MIEMTNKILVSLGVLFCLAALAQANVITLTTTVNTPKIFKSGLNEVTVALKNTGDESARGLYLEVILPDGFKSKDVNIGDIGINEEVNVAFNVTVPEKVKGKYPLVLRIHYADGNSYPFSAITYTGMNVGAEKPQNVYGNADKITVPKDGEEKITVKVTNRGDKKQTITSTIYMPTEFKADQVKKTFDANAKSQTEVAYKVGDLGGVSGNTYVGTVALEYDDGEHNTIFIPVFMESTLPKADNSYILVIAGLLLVVILLVRTKMVRDDSKKEMEAAKETGKKHKRGHKKP